MEKINYVSYPKVRMRPDGLVEVEVYYNDKRMRLQSGRRFGVNLRPNTFPEHERINQGDILAAEIYRKMLTEDYITIKPRRKYRGNQGRNPKRQSTSFMVVTVLVLIALISLIANLFILWTRQ